MLRRTYIYHHPDWPDFRWDWEVVAPLLAQVRYNQGAYLGQLKSLGIDRNPDLSISNLTASVTTSSRIEEEILDPQRVRSSIVRRLGLDTAGLPSSTPDIEGIVEVTLDATQNYHCPLTKERLFRWHRALFPAGHSNMGPITVGEWRQDLQYPMRVISGPVGNEKVHFEAPPASTVDSEMSAFLYWFNHDHDTDYVMKAAIAHLWFVMIHPFDDGNGRIARVITDQCLSRADRSSTRAYSLSERILAERADYYRILERTGKGDLAITDWIVWFLHCLDRSIESAEQKIETSLQKARFWQAHSQSALNARQSKVINRLLNGFTGNLTTSRWARMTRCSQDTALRDIRDLIDKSILAKNPGGGRRTSYRLVL